MLPIAAATASIVMELPLASTRNLNEHAVLDSDQGADIGATCNAVSTASTWFRRLDSNACEFRELQLVLKPTTKSIVLDLTIVVKLPPWYAAARSEARDLRLQPESDYRHVNQAICLSKACHSAGFPPS